MSGIGRLVSCFLAALAGVAAAETARGAPAVTAHPPPGIVLQEPPAAAFGTEEEAACRFDPAARDPPVEDGQRPAGRRDPPAKIGPAARPVDLRTATAEELQQLPGIGRVRAEAIMLFRARRPLRSVRDLQRIWGIGPKLLERIAPFVTVSPAPPAGPAPPSSPRPAPLEAALARPAG